MNSNESTQGRWVRAAVDRHGGPLTRYALLLTGDLEAARDVVQETFVRLCGQDAGKIDGHLAQWLFTVCRNRAMDVRRGQGRMKPWSEAEMLTLPSHDPAPEAQAQTSESVSEVFSLLATLPQNQQEVIRLKFQGGLSYQQISAVTGLSVSNVGFLMHVGIKTLRQKMQIPGAVTRRTIKELS